MDARVFLQRFFSILNHYPQKGGYPQDLNYDPHCPSIGLSFKTKMEFLRFAGAARMGVQYQTTLSRDSDEKEFLRNFQAFVCDIC